MFIIQLLLSNINDVLKQQIKLIAFPKRFINCTDSLNPQFQKSLYFNAVTTKIRNYNDSKIDIDYSLVVLTHQSIDSLEAHMFVFLCPPPPLASNENCPYQHPC